MEDVVDTLCHAILVIRRRLVAVGIEVTKGRMVTHLTIFAKHE